MRKGRVARIGVSFLVAIGIVNLFADLTYEGSRSITGPFLQMLGASAAAVGIVAGAGEMLGYGLRSVSGFLADRTRRYWTVTLIGYAINMLAVPALALAGAWPVAAALIIAERTGRAIRKPAVESLLAATAPARGRGFVFGLNEAMDQAGATVGPLIVALVLYLHGTYRHAFAILLVSALLCLGTLAVARALHGGSAEPARRSVPARELPGAYWRYVAGGALVAAGFADFALISFHFARRAVVAPGAIPLFYAAAMASGALAALAMGRLFDRLGSPVVIVAVFLGAMAAPLAFFGGLALALLGLILWGIGLAAQEALLKAVLSGILPADRRSTAFGLYDTAFGVAWFVGSATMGILYGRSIAAVVAFSVALQVVALPVFVWAHRQEA